MADGRLARLPVAVRFWDGSTLPAAGAPDAPVVVVRDRSAIAHILHRPDQLGLARAWVAGTLDAEGDLETALGARENLTGLTLGTRERLALLRDALRIAGPRILLPPPVPEIEARAAGRRHSLRRDRQAIRHHYDVSNRFYELVLGPSMVYSCAYFAEPEEDLESAQERKLEVICRKLRLQPGERLLDVGCGWGSLLLHAARHHGVHGVGVTLSEQQAVMARRRIAEAGLSDRLEVRVCDYREIADGPFDKIASVGMYEHVGRDELHRYAAILEGLLRPGGLVLNHGIARLAPHAPAPDPFITRYVFPDGELHPVTDVMASMQAAGLEVRDVESLREHYALTLRRWVDNLLAHREEAIGEVGAPRERVWHMYMLGSAMAFEEREITIYQVLAARGGAAHGLPLVREGVPATG
nr:class I SAM-dependent methyltransferase [Baekduia soli]